MKYEFRLRDDVKNKEKAHKALLELKMFDTVIVYGYNENELNFTRIPGGYVFTMDGNQSFIQWWYMEDIEDVKY